MPASTSRPRSLTASGTSTSPPAHSFHRGLDGPLSTAQSISATFALARARDSKRERGRERGPETGLTMIDLQCCTLHRPLAQTFVSLALPPSRWAKWANDALLERSRCSPRATSILRSAAFATAKRVLTPTHHDHEDSKIRRFNISA